MLTAHGSRLAKVSLKCYVQYMKKAPLRRSAEYSRSCCRCQSQSNFRDVIDEAEIFHREDKRAFLVRDEENEGAGNVRSKMSMYEECLLNPCNVVAQLVSSQPVTVDLTLTCFSYTDVLGPSRISRKQLAHSALRTLHPFCVVSHSCMVTEPVILELWSCSIPGIVVLEY